MRPAAYAALLTLTLIALAGCAQQEPTAPPENSTPPSSEVRPAAEILAGLALPVLPDAERCLKDLEAFVALAPRRFDNKFEHDAARDWLETELAKAGLATSRYRFTSDAQTPGGAPLEAQNILGTLPGKDPDAGLLMFGAHYDGAFNGYGAAYDDGSGTLLTLELARAMAAYEWNHTLVFGFWDQEEAGLVGSEAYAQMLEAEDETVALYVNFDMTGINWPAKFGGTTDVPMKVDFGGEGEDVFAQSWKDVATHLEFPPQATTVRTGASGGATDHASFLASGFPAAWVRGALTGNYPMYHNADTVETMILDVGGDRADLVAGFDTVLQTVFRFAFLADQPVAAVAA